MVIHYNFKNFMSAYYISVRHNLPIKQLNRLIAPAIFDIPGVIGMFYLTMDLNETQKN